MLSSWFLTCDLLPAIVIVAALVAQQIRALPLPLQDAISAPLVPRGNTFPAAHPCLTDCLDEMKEGMAIGPHQPFSGAYYPLATHRPPLPQRMMDVPMVPLRKKWDASSYVASPSGHKRPDGTVIDSDDGSPPGTPRLQRDPLKGKAPMEYHLKPAKPRQPSRSPSGLHMRQH